MHNYSSVLCKLSITVYTHPYTHFSYITYSQDYPIHAILSSSVSILISSLTATSMLATAPSKSTSNPQYGWIHVASIDKLHTLHQPYIFYTQD